MNPVFQRDLTSLISVKDFGQFAETATCGRVEGIFDNEDVEEQQDYGRPTIHRKAVFTTLESHKLTSGEIVTIDGTAFELKSPMRDGHGLVAWQLERV